MRDPQSLHNRNTHSDENDMDAGVEEEEQERHRLPWSPSAPTSSTPSNPMVRYGTAPHRRLSLSPSIGRLLSCTPVADVFWFFFSFFFMRGLIDWCRHGAAVESLAAGRRAAGRDAHRGSTGSEWVLPLLFAGWFFLSSILALCYSYCSEN